MSAILADIGGTHIRIASLGADGPADPQKRLAADFTDLPDALCACTGGGQGDLYIATAAWPGADGVWRFNRPGRWPVIPGDLAGQGWNLRWIGNDFAASARGAASLGAPGLHCVRPASDSPAPAAPDEAGCSAVLGAGTGLGLAYVRGRSVQETYGGQMEIPQRTDEQHTILRLVARLKGDGRPVSAEDAVSGPGIALLYRACRLLHGLPAAEDGADLAFILQRAAAGDPAGREALRLFHEFLGLFAHQAVIYGHAFDGLYLDGGAIHRILEAGLFDSSVFLSFFTGDPVPVVKTRMAAMPVHIVTDPYIALHGLAAIARSDSNA